MEELALSNSVLRISPFEEGDELEGGRVGMVDLTLHVKGTSSDEVHGVAEVRVYYTDRSMSVSQIVTEAPRRAIEICRQIAHGSMPMRFHFNGENR
jgi:hypothetical protein